MLRSQYILLLSCFVLGLSIISSTRAQEPITVVPSPGTQEQDKALANLKAGLQKRITVDFKDTPLAEVVAYLQEKTGVPFRIDHRALDDVGLLDDVPITIKLTQVRLKTVLTLTLRQLDLTWVNSDNRIMITNPGDAEEHLEARYYYVLDLVKPGEQYEPDFDSIINVIGTSIEPESWGAFSGPPPLYAVDEGIVFEQSEEIHEKVAALLKTLRRVKKLPNNQYDVTPIEIMATDPSDRSVREKLLKSIKEVNFKETSLLEVMDFLSQEIDLNIFINEWSLEDIGFSSSHIVSGQWKNTSVETILRDLLSENDLTFMIYDDVVMITTPEEAEADLITRVYPIRDFVEQESRDYELLNWNSHYYGGSNDYDHLIEVITISIELNSWEETGGPGAISPFELADCLVISQTDEVHQKIEELLTRIRQKRKGQPIDKPWLVNAGQPFVHAYTLPGLFAQRNTPSDAGIQKSLERLMALITNKVEPESWRNDDNTIEIIGDRLIVTQVRANHLKIYQFLEDLGFLSPSQTPGRGFGFGEAPLMDLSQPKKEAGEVEESDPPMQGGFF